MGYGEADGYGSLTAGLLQIFITLVAYGVFVVLAFFLVRFLIVATRAAQIYVDKNGPRPTPLTGYGAPTGPTGPTPSGSASPEPSAE